MGNIREFETFEELWNSDQANHVRGLVRTCPKNCWMVGTAAPVMKKYIQHPVKWVAKNKIKSLLGRPICIQQIPKCDVGQDPRQGDLRIDKHAQIRVENPSATKYILPEKEIAQMLKDR